MRCAIVEAEVREEVMLDMEQRMREMEEIHARRLIREVRVYFYLHTIFAC